MTKLRVLAATMLAIQLATTPAVATPTKVECVAAHEESQRLRRDGHLRAARTDLLTCANDACPAAVVSECVPWLAEVERALPTVVFVARLPNGSDAADVAVWIDGARVQDVLDGRATPMDPGEHQVRFVRASEGRPIDRRIVIAEGEKARVVRVDFPPMEAPEPPPASPAWHVPWGTYVLGGTSVLALGGFTAFAIAGQDAEHGLRDCSPACSPSRVDPVRRDYITADVMLGVGVVAAAIAGVLFLTQGESPAAHGAGARSTSQVPSFERSMLK